MLNFPNRSRSEILFLSLTHLSSARYKYPHPTKVNGKPLKMLRKDKVLFASELVKNYKNKFAEI